MSWSETAPTKPPADRPETVEIGWLLSPGEATFVYDAPRPVEIAPPPGLEDDGAVLCGDATTQFFEVPCPFDLHVRLARDANGKLKLIDAAPESSRQRHNVLRAHVTLMGQSRWRDPKRPLLQIGAPWRFVTDAQVQMTQLPAIGHYYDPPLPGLMIGGRFPIHLWPRSLMWAFDWWEPQKELVLKRGDPWFYLRFETERPNCRIAMVEAEMTPELTEFCKGLDGVTNYVNQTFKLFKTAQERRPPTLLKRKERA